MPKKTETMLLLANGNNGFKDVSQADQDDAFCKAHSGQEILKVEIIGKQSITYESPRDRAEKLLKEQGWNASDIMHALRPEVEEFKSTKPTEPPEAPAEPKAQDEVPEDWESLGATELKKLARKVTGQNTSKWVKEACMTAIRKHMNKASETHESTPIGDEDPVQVPWEGGAPLPVPPPAIPSIAPPPTVLPLPLDVPPETPKASTSPRGGIPAPPPPSPMG